MSLSRPEIKSSPSCKKPRSPVRSQGPFSRISQICIKYLLRLGRLIPVPRRHAGIRHPNFSDLVSAALGQILWIDDGDFCVAHQFAATDNLRPARPTPAGTTRPSMTGVRVQLENARAGIESCGRDEQRCFGKPVGGRGGSPSKTAWLKRLDKLLQHIRVDRLCRISGRFPGGEVQASPIPGRLFGECNAHKRNLAPENACPRTW